jgi:hypothetical protein
MTIPQPAVFVTHLLIHGMYVYMYVYVHMKVPGTWINVALICSWQESDSAAQLLFVDTPLHVLLLCVAFFRNINPSLNSDSLYI